MSDYESLAQIDKEIARVESLLAEPGFKYLNMAKVRLSGLKAIRKRFTSPLQYQLRVVISRWLQSLADLVGP